MFFFIFIQDVYLKAPTSYGNRGIHHSGIVRAHVNVCPMNSFMVTLVIGQLAVIAASHFVEIEPRYGRDRVVNVL